MVNNVPGGLQKTLKWHEYDGKKNAFTIEKPPERVSPTYLSMLVEAYHIINKRYDSQRFTARQIFLEDFQTDARIANLSAEAITAPKEVETVDRSQSTPDAKRRRTGDKGKGPTSVPESSSPAINRNRPVNVFSDPAEPQKSPRLQFIEEIFTVFYQGNTALHYFGFLKDDNLVQNIEILAEKIAGVESGYIIVPVLIDNLFNVLYAVDIEGKAIHYCPSVISNGSSESERIVKEFFDAFAFTMEYPVLTHSIREHLLCSEFQSMYGIESLWIISCMHAFNANAFMRSQGYNIEPQIHLDKDELLRMQSYYLQWIKTSR